MLKKLAMTVSLGAVLATLTSSTLSAHAVDRYGNSDPRVTTTTVASQNSITFRPVLFSSPDVGVVEVAGEGSTKLDVAVYDTKGNLIIHYAGYSPRVTFYPYWTAGFVIKVTNLGYVSNTFTLHTN
jgi:hypothetical protein